MLRLPVWLCDGKYVPNGIALLLTDEEPFVQVIGTNESDHVHRGASMSLSATKDSLSWLKSTLQGDVELGIITEETVNKIWDAFLLVLLQHYFDVRDPKYNHVRASAVGMHSCSGI